MIHATCGSLGSLMSHVNFIPTEHTQSESSRSSARDILRVRVWVSAPAPMYWSRCPGVPCVPVSRRPVPVSRCAVQTAQWLLTPACGAPVTLRWRLNLQVSRARAHRGGAEKGRGGVGGPSELNIDYHRCYQSMIDHSGWCSDYSIYPECCHFVCSYMSYLELISPGVRVCVFVYVCPCVCACVCVPVCVGCKHFCVSPKTNKLIIHQ